MTSSLVGSEMCIRDSTSCVQQQEAAAVPLVTPTIAASSPVESMLAHAPVSYTHLTLPTICSV
eukprot:11409742-Prorocentrum_lima.AAC.1